MTTERADTLRRTLLRWLPVIRGSQKHIFPYEEEADVLFNTSLVYELSVLKGYAEPMLRLFQRCHRPRRGPTVALHSSLCSGNSIRQRSQFIHYEGSLLAVAVSICKGAPMHSIFDGTEYLVS